MTRYNFSVALIRGKYTNQCELQNFEPLVKSVKIKAFSSLFSLESPKNLSTIRLPSPADLPFSSGVVKYIANRTIGDMHMLYGLEKELSSYDILHTADPYYYYSFQAAKIKEKNPKKILITSVWETIPFNNEGTKTKQRLKNFVQENTDLFITYSNKAKEALIKEGIPKRKIAYVPLGVDTNRFTPVKNSRKEILFVGRLVPEKNPLHLFEAFRVFHQTNHDYTLRFIGKGQLENELKKRIEHYGLTQSVAVSFVNYNDIPLYYQNALIFVLPSQHTATWEEQYGMVLLEAMSSGLPIITTDCGAIPEVLGSAGIVIPQNNVTALVKVLHKLARSRTTRLKLGTIARERAVSVFNRNSFSRQILTIYETYFSGHTSNE